MAFAAESCPPICRGGIQILQLLRLEIGAIYVTTFPPTSAQCSPEGGTGSGRGLLPICSRFCRSEGPSSSPSSPLSYGQQAVRPTARRSPFK